MQFDPLGKRRKRNRLKDFLYSFGIFFLLCLSFLAGPKEVRAELFSSPTAPCPLASVKKNKEPAKDLYTAFSVQTTYFEKSSRTDRITPCQAPSFSLSHLSYPLSFSEAFLYSGNRSRDRIFRDFQNFYRRETLGSYGIALLVGGIMANTKMDRNFHHWYQKQIRCSFTNEFSEFTRVFGEGKIFIPVAVTTACIYRFRQERFGTVHQNKVVGNFFDRTARGYAVGTPTLLLSQISLGGNRPQEGSSYWKPFCGEDHTLSGHAFIGAIPFITAAHMSEPLWLKGVFYTLSTIPAWSRVNDDAHYLSQSLIGWYLAWLSVRAVSETEGMKPLPKGLMFFPVADGNNVGIGFVYRR